MTTTTRSRYPALLAFWSYFCINVVIAKGLECPFSFEEKPFEGSSIHPSFFENAFESAFKQDNDNSMVICASATDLALSCGQIGILQNATLVIIQDCFAGDNSVVRDGCRLVSGADLKDGVIAQFTKDYSDKEIFEVIPNDYVKFSICFRNTMPHDSTVNFSSTESLFMHNIGLPFTLFVAFGIVLMNIK